MQKNVLTKHCLGHSGGTSSVNVNVRRIKKKKEHMRNQSKFHEVAVIYSFINFGIPNNLYI